METTPEEPPLRAATTKRRTWLTLLRVALAVLPLVWLARMIKPREIAARIAHVPLGTMLFAYALLVAAVAAGALRWSLLLRGYDVRPPKLSTLFRHCLVALYFNLIPSGIAGDAVRGYRVRAVVPNLTTSYAILFVERLCGLAGLLLISGGALIFGPSDSIFARFFAACVIGGGGVAIAALGVPFLLERSPSLRGRLGKLPLVGAILLRIPRPRGASSLLAPIVLSIATQGLAIVSIGLLLRSFADVAVADVARTIPICILLTFLPITPGGLGQREAIFTYVLARVNVPAGAAVGCSVMVLLANVAVAATGGALVALERLFGWEEK